MSNQLIGIIIFAVFGLIIGSLLNVVILRFDDLKSILKTRSRCPHCKKEIAWYDLVPFFSYVFLAAKCRSCKKSISIQYPLVEVGTGLLFGLLFWQFGLSAQFFALMIISSILIVIFTYDILHYLISDFLVYICIGVWLLYLIIDYFFIHNSLSSILYSLYGGLGLGGFLALLVLASRQKWMGAGDIALGFLLGAITGWPNVLLAGFLAFALGSLVGIILILANLKSMKDKVPFAPFLITGALIALFLGDMIVGWYLAMLGI